MTLDIEQPGSLEAYLRKNNYILPEEPVDTLPLAGGVSNRTVLIRRANGEAWVVKQALEKLRVAVDWFSSPTRIHREALALRIVAQLLPAGTVPLGAGRRVRPSAARRPGAGSRPCRGPRPVR